MELKYFLRIKYQLKVVRKACLLTLKLIFSNPN